MGKVDEIKRQIVGRLERAPSISNVPYVKGNTRAVLDWFKPFAFEVLDNVVVFDEQKKVVLLTACSYAKPYSMSWIHYSIRKALEDVNLMCAVEYWHLSSAGVIPACLEEVSPFNCYDWNNEFATEDDKADLRKALAGYCNVFCDRYVYPLKKKLVTYFRRDSNTQTAIDGEFDYVEGPIHCRVSSHMLSIAPISHDYIKDPDWVLAHPINLGLLIGNIFRALETKDE